MSVSKILEAARALGPRIRLAADTTEATRRLPADLVRELARAGCFRMLVPRSCGGGEVDPPLMIRVIEEVARADASAGWCVMVGATSGLLAAYLEADVAREVFGDPELVAAGVFAPLGSAATEGDHYRVSGRWPFFSGVEHSTWRMGGAVIDGGREVRQLLFHAEQTEVLDTWKTVGMRGSGSHDLVVKDALVPVARSVSMVGAPPRESGPLYRFPLFGLLSLGVAAVALGIGRTAIEALGEVAREKRPGGGKRTLAQREATQIDVARAEGLLRSARAFMFEAAEAALAQARTGDPLTISDRATLRLAATHATRASADAVDLMYDAAGATSIYDSSILQRCFRDVHVATQHGMVAPAMYGAVGRVLLDVETDTSTL